LKIPIDKQVTVDPTRLSRIRGSLNGKASLIVSDILDESFTPSFQLSPFRGEVSVKARVEVPSMRVLGREVSLRPGEEADLEAPIAVLLASKNAVEIVGGEVVVD
ncbi:MAG: DNA primase, partial [Acidilobaceae archaeon]